jgi:ATP-dependent Clp protease ATP-binding subunit ClpA
MKNLIARIKKASQDFNPKLEIFTDKLADNSRRLIRNAYEEALARGHNQLSSEHIFIAIAKLESSLFNELMRSLTLNPQVVIEALETKLRQGAHSGRSIKMSESVRDLLSNSLKQAHEGGRRQIESTDLFVALFKDAGSYPMKLLRQLGVDREFMMQKVEDFSRKQ